MYVAVKGGEAAIAAAHDLFASRRRGAPEVEELALKQIAGQLRYAVDRAMAEGSLYDRSLAALAGRDLEGNVLEAGFARERLGEPVSGDLYGGRLHPRGRGGRPRGVEHAHEKRQSPMKSSYCGKPAVV